MGLFGAWRLDDASTISLSLGGVVDNWDPMIIDDEIRTMVELGRMGYPKATPCGGEATLKRYAKESKQKNCKEETETSWTR